MSSPSTSHDNPPARLLSPSIEPTSPHSPDANATFRFDLDLRSPSPVNFDNDNDTHSFDYNQCLRSPSPIGIDDNIFRKTGITKSELFLQSSRVDNESNSDFDTGEASMSSVSSSSSDTVVAVSNFANDNLMDVDNQSEAGSDMTLDDQTPTFHSFGRIPVAVRRLIWALNLPGPRLVEVIWKEGKQEDGWYSNAPIIANLSTCRESRLEALKTHPLSFACHASLARIPFKFGTDTLFLGRKMVGTHQTFKKERVGNDLAKVQFLVVDAALKWGKRGKYDTKYDRGFGNFGHISHLIFSGVKQHTVLYTGNTDPLPSWADSRWFRRVVSPRWQHDNPAKVIHRFKQNWPHPPGRIQLHPSNAEEFKHGGIPAEEKFDPAISQWRVPKVFSFGVTTRVSDGFEGSAECNWPMILMDRVIEDIFT